MSARQQGPDSPELWRPVSRSMASRHEESPLLGELDAVAFEQTNLSSIAAREFLSPLEYEDAAPPREAGTLERHWKRASYKEKAFWGMGSGNLL